MTNSGEGLFRVQATSSGHVDNYSSRGRRDLTMVLVTVTMTTMAQQAGAVF